MRKPIEPMPRERRSTSISRSDAEAIAIEALRFFGADAHRLRRFLALSGLEGSDLRRAASSQDFLLGVMEHLMADEPLLVAFAAETQHDPAALVRARDALRRQADPEPE